MNTKTNGEASANAFHAPETSMDCTILYNKMLSYAMKKHSDSEQEYANGMPYIVHCIGVSNIASRFGYRVDDIEIGYKVHLVCLGHDLLEDTNAKYQELVHLYGPEIAEAIYVLADEKGRDRDEKNQKTWPVIQGNELGRIVKPCDRLFNLETSIAGRSTQLRRYVKEHVGLRKMLYTKETHAMWVYMDELFIRASDILHDIDNARQTLKLS